MIEQAIPDVIDRGAGDPVVVIPGIQGRWRYVEATVEALAKTHRALTFSLAGEPDGRPFDPVLGFDNYVADVDAVLDRAGVARAALVGISFGGLVAMRYAAARPSRVRAVVLVSVPGPEWTLTRRHRWYLRAPRLFGLCFLVESPLRVGPEIRASFASSADRLRFSIQQLGVWLRAPLSFARMAERAALAAAADRRGDAARLEIPTLIVTGERALDRVVPVDGTLEYARLIGGARACTLAGTGHLGSLTSADRFAGIVDAFLDGLAHAAA